jgi:16S rRNA processing protein RimM
MTRSDLIVIGAIAGAHGVRGDAKVKPFGDPTQLTAYGPFLDAAGAVLLTPVGSKPGPNGLSIVWFKERRTREEMQALKGTLLHAPRASLPELEDDEFYHADLIGLTVETLDGKPLGIVKAVHDFGAGDLLEVASETDTQLIPFTKAAVPHVDLKGGKLIANPPVDGGETQAEEEKGR